MHGGQSGRALCPFAITVEPVAAMLNLELADDPVYAGIEVQRVDDPIHGTGFVVLLVRRADRLVDVYRQPGLTLDPASYAVSGGLGEWREADIDPARLEIAPTGVAVDVAFRDAAGRLVEIPADDRDGRRRTRAALLAPVSAAVERPTSMMIVWMPSFDLMRTGGRPLEIRIDGRSARTGSLPAAFLHKRRLVKYAADLLVVRLNPSFDGPLEARVDGPSIGGAEATTAGRLAKLVLDPPMPDPARLLDGVAATGVWHVDVDGTSSIVGGTWSATRDGEQVRLVLDATQPWRPGPLPLLMRIVTRIVPTFRSWPRTYRWQAVVELGDAPVMRSSWERTGLERGDGYRRAMGLSGR